jgi:hypothetical protein
MSPITELIGGTKAYGWGSFSLSTAFDSIATVTVGSGGAANVEFTSIPSTYTHLQIRGMYKVTAVNGGSPRVTLNGDSGNNYAMHAINGDGSSVSVNDYSSADLFYNGIGYQRTGQFSVFITDILDYANTNKYKTVRTLAGFDENGSGAVGLLSALWQSTNAITSWKMVPQPTANFAQYSHFALYGIKSA